MKLFNLIIILSLVFISGCAITGYFSKDMCNNETIIDLRDDCYAKLAINSTDISICEKIEDPRTINLCHTKIAIKTNDVKLCGDLQDDVYWRDICFSEIAESELDASICFLIINEADKNDCFYNISIETNDADLCNAITNITKQERCIYNIAVATEKTSICSTLSTQLNKDTCLYKIAKNTLNNSICDLIKIDNIKERCINNTKI